MNQFVLGSAVYTLNLTGLIMLYELITITEIFVYNHPKFESLRSSTIQIDANLGWL